MLAREEPENGDAFGRARVHDVVALDVSPGAVEVCRRRGVKEVFPGTWRVTDTLPGAEYCAVLARA